MTFQPVIPLAGYAGWRFLQRTMESQQTAFQESAPVKRDTDYFREKIGSIKTAEDLVADRRLLSVALGAYGLDDDINNKYFIERVLGDGIASDDALSNRLSDKRYFAFSLAFGLGNDAVPRTGLTFFADDIIARYEQKQFALSVGDQDEDMRLALNVEGALKDIVANNTSENAQWFSVLGNAPLRKVIETALGLPSSIGRIDLDQQLTSFKDRAQSVFGSDKVADLAADQTQEDLIRLFLVRSQAEQSAQINSGNIALSLLQSGPVFNAL